MDYKVCLRCILDTTAEDIIFDKRGICNFCTEFLNNYHQYINTKKSELESFIQSIKTEGKGKQYDCLVGVSGGVDSSYVLHLTKLFGLRPLAVHMDNNWNAELATNNISNLVKNLDVDLYTHVIDWNEYKGLMEAFFKAHVIDIELLYDNAMLSVNYELAKKYKINYILSGMNSATEGIKMPKGWHWFKYDKKNIVSINKKFGYSKIKTFPAIGTNRMLYLKLIKKIKWVPFLDYVDYNKNEALKILLDSYEYKPYPYKHYESIFTRLYQGYILPKKFNVDKRKLHLSNLVCTDLLTRDEGLANLNKIAYSSEADLDQDISFFLKKMGWSRDLFEEYLRQPGISHDTYGSEKKYHDFIVSNLLKVKRIFS